MPPLGLIISLSTDDWLFRILGNIEADEETPDSLEPFYSSQTLSEYQDQNAPEPD